MAEWEKMLIAIDEEETSIKALRYVCKVARNVENLSICLLHVYPAPPPHFYAQGGTLDEYRAREEHLSQKIFSRASRVLAECGLTARDLECKALMADGLTISETVLKAQREGGYGTVVVGKRGVSKAEEFLFGSISNSLAKHSKDFSAWIVG